MIKITLVVLGKLKESYLKDAAQEYSKRLGAFCKLCVIELEPVRLPESPSEGEVKAALSVEGKKILEKIPPGADLIPLCIEGKQMSSPEFSRYLHHRAAAGGGNFVFLIGSSYGLCEEIKRLAALKLSMSLMTFPHQFARVMLLEQLYRAFRLEQGGSYHK